MHVSRHYDFHRCPFLRGFNFTHVKTSMATSGVTLCRFKLPHLLSFLLAFVSLITFSLSIKINIQKLLQHQNHKTPKRRNNDDAFASSALKFGLQCCHLFIRITETNLHLCCMLTWLHTHVKATR